MDKESGCLGHTLPYYLWLDDHAQGIATIVTCLCGATRVTSLAVELRKHPEILHFIASQFAGLNEFTEKFNLGDEINREVSVLFHHRVASMLGMSDPGLTGR